MRASDRAADDHLLSMVTQSHGDQPPNGGGEARPQGSDPTPGSAPESAERRYDMRIDRDGQWHHEGRPIARAPLVKLFASVLKKRDDGYWLETPVERGRIEVEDVPFVMVELKVADIGRHQTISLRSNLDEWVAIGSDHPLLLRQPPHASPKNVSAPTVSIPYVIVRSGLEGRLSRPVYYELADLGEPHRLDGVTRYGVWSQEQFFALDEQPV